MKNKFCDNCDQLLTPEEYNKQKCFRCGEEQT